MRTEKGLRQSLALRKLIPRKRMGKDIFQTLHPGCLANSRSGRVPGGSHPSTENSALQLGQNWEGTVGNVALNIPSEEGSGKGCWQNQRQKQGTGIRLCVAT